eukprot:246393_1
MKLVYLLITLPSILATNINCDFVKCLAPLCASNEELFTPPGQCCARCTRKGNSPNCATVLCAAVACADGEEQFIPGGQCCPKCRNCGNGQNACPNGNCFCKDCGGNCVWDVAVECFADPCAANPCNEGETCTSNYCGGCNACCA